MEQVTVDRRKREGSPMRTLLAVVIVILVLLLATLGYFFFRVLTPASLGEPGGGASGDGLIWIRSMYGFGPSQEEQLWRPTSVAIAPNGNIMATDPQRSRLMEFGPSGAFIRTIYGQGNLEQKGFFRPEAIDIDDNGEVYVVDQLLNRIVVLDASGRVVRQWDGAKKARGVTVTDDAVYLLDEGKVIKYSKTGELLGSIGRRGRMPGELDAYQGIVSDGENVYVADALNGRLQAFDQAGTLMWAEPPMRDMAVGSEMTSQTTTANTIRNEKEQSASPYDLPQDLVFDANGRLVVIDAFAFKMLVVDPKTGKVKESYGDWGAKDGAFLYPTSIDYDPERDWFAVADTKNNRIQLVSIPGSGGGAMSLLRRTLVSPYRYCAIPLGLLLLALLIAVLSSRRRRSDEEFEGEPQAA